MRIGLAGRGVAAFARGAGEGAALARPGAGAVAAQAVHAIAGQTLRTLFARRPVRLLPAGSVHARVRWDTVAVILANRNACRAGALEGRAVDLTDGLAVPEPIAGARGDVDAARARRGHTLGLLGINGAAPEAIARPRLSASRFRGRRAVRVAQTGSERPTLTGKPRLVAGDARVAAGGAAADAVAAVTRGAIAVGGAGSPSWKGAALAALTVDAGAAVRIGRALGLAGRPGAVVGITALILSQLAAALPVADVDAGHSISAAGATLADRR
jgi:hypothetical protein